MPWRWAAALAFALLAPAPPAANARAAEDPAALIDACLARLDYGVDVGFERIAVRCPELAQHLQTSAWGSWLPRGWQDPHNNLSARGLAQLELLAVRERQFLRGARVLEVPQLKPILANLARNNEASTEPGWWARFKKWLQGLRTAPEPDSRDGWLARLLGHISLSQAVIKFVSYIMLGLVVVFASYIVVNEVLAAGLYRRRRAARAKAIEGADANCEVLSWQDVERAAPGDRAAVLLLLIAARLAATQRLPAYRALTVRELAQGARLSDAADRARLGEVALAAEAYRYSSQATTSASLARVIERGHELFERLGDPAWRAGPAREAA
jgi:hypothetical protein